jgi:hypothetical protein
MISKVAKDLIIKSGNYHIENFEQHTVNYDAVLKELTAKNINDKTNILRLLNFDTERSSEEKSKEIVNVFEVESTTKSFLYPFISDVNLIIDKMQLLERVPYEQVQLSNDYILHLSKNKGILLKEILLESKARTISEVELELFAALISKKLCSADLPFFYELLKMSSFSEIVTCTCFDHKILMLVGAKVFLPFMYSLYKTNTLKYLLNELIYKLNFKGICFSVKENIRQLIIPVTFVITGVFFSGQLKGVIDLQRIRDVYDVTSKDYKFDGPLGEAIDSLSLVLKKTGTATGDLIKAPVQGFYFSLFKPWADSFFSTAEWWFKQK